MGFSRQEHWRGLPCPPPGDLPDPGIKLTSVTSPPLAGGFFTKGFPHGSAGKEATYNAGVLGSIPRLGRSPGEGKGYAIQYSGLENSMDCIIHGVAKSQIWLSDFGLPLAQLVKKPPAMWETWVWTLGWEDPLEKGKATQSSILAWRVPWTV